jgi:hypothetical protein
MAQRFFRPNFCITFTVVKSCPKISFASFVIFKNLPKVNDQQRGENWPNLVTLAGSDGDSQKLAQDEQQEEERCCSVIAGHQCDQEPILRLFLFTPTTPALQ